MTLERRSEEATLDVVIVTATGCRPHIGPCLASLRRYPLRQGRMRVYVVDNASTDGTPGYIRSEFPEVELIALDRNEGFSYANNIVLRTTKAPFVLLLNPDTEAIEPFLDEMLAAISRRPEVGMAGCRLILRDGSFDHAAKRSFPTPLSALAHFTGVGRRPGAGSSLAQYRATGLGEHECGPVDAVNGAFMLVRADALRDVGLLDEGYWLYMEDLDWCRRFGERGWTVWYEGSVTVVHVKGGSSGDGHRSPRATLAFHRSMGRFYRRYEAGRRPLVDIAVYLAIAGKALIALARGGIARRRST